MDGPPAKGPFGVVFCVDDGMMAVREIFAEIALLCGLSNELEKEEGEESQVRPKEGVHTVGRDWLDGADGVAGKNVSEGAGGASRKPPAVWKSAKRKRQHAVAKRRTLVWWQRLQTPCRRRI